MNTARDSIVDPMRQLQVLLSFSFLLLLLALLVPTTTGSNTNFAVSNFESLIDGNLNGLYGQVSLTNENSECNITYILCSPTNPLAVNATARFLINSNLSTNACSPYCNKPPDENGCITGFIQYNDTSSNITQIDVTDRLGVVIGTFRGRWVQEIYTSPPAPSPAAVIETYYTTTNPTTLPPTTLPPTTLPPTTLPPTTLPPTTLPPTTLPPTTFPPTTLPPTAAPIVNCSPGSYYFNSTTCIACPVGYYQNNVNATLCLPCSSGYYQSNTNSTSCLSCSSGYYQPNNSSTSCLLCGSGYYQSSTNSTSCLSCNSGYYQSSTGSTVCISCSAGRYQPNTNATSCLSCTPGQYQPGFNATTCLLCNGGQYQMNTSSSSCAPCIAGYFQPSTGSTVCLACDAGYYQPNTGSTSCSPCGSGAYQANIGSASCTLCSAGSYQLNTNSTSCTSCSAGAYQPNTNSTSCILCGTGTYQPNTNSTSCLLCSAGTYQPNSNSTSCLSCGAGTYQPNTQSTTCLSCSPGSYQNNTGSSICNICASGSFQNQTAAQTPCTMCIAGEYQPNTNATSCLGCQPGSYQNATGASMCIQCLAGSFFNSSGVTVCESCEPGTFQPSSDSVSCEECGPGMFSGSSGATACASCGLGTYQGNSNSSSCASCPTGMFQNNTGQQGCLECPIGTYQNVTGLSSCTQCPTGTYQNDTGSSGCISCSAGTFQNITDSSNCVSCPSGTYQNITMATVCIQCQAGTFQPGNGSTSCASCGPGTFSSSPSAVACVACGLGMYQSNFSSSTCASCPAGMFQNNTGQQTCMSCPVGTYQNTTGSSNCVSCTSGTYQNATGSTVCISCVMGTFQPGNSSISCASCGPGTFSSSPNAVSCVACGLGAYQNSSSSSSCAPCAAGTYQNNTGQTVCVSCPPTTYQNNTGSSSCPSCPPGTYQGISTPPNTCQPCLVEFYQDSPGQTSCIACAPGSYQTNQGQSICIQCSAGTFQDFRNVSHCIPCPVGHYQGNPGATICSSCSSGSYQNRTGSTGCVSCPGGSYQPNPAASNCTLCADGTYQFTPGSTTCIQCSDGSYQNGTGSTMCFPCQLGSYQDSPDSTDCLLCDFGSYSNTTNTTDCTQCNPGQYQNITGATICDDCPEGTLTGNYGSTNCFPCGTGAFGNMTGQTTCFSCDVGQYQNISVATSCQWCPEGTGNSIPGLANCPPCDQGTYQNITGQLNCTFCDEGTHQNNTGAAECVLCSPGTFSNSTGMALCFDCPIGQYQNISGATECTACGINTYADVEGLSSCIDCPYGEQTFTTGQSSCVDITPGAVSYIVNSQSDPTTLSWTVALYTALYVVELNTFVDTAPSNTYTINPYNESIWYDVVVFVISPQGLQGPHNFTVLPAQTEADNSTMLTFNYYTRILNISWTLTPYDGVQSDVEYAFIVYFTNTDTGITTIRDTAQTFAVFNNIPNNANLTWVIQTFLPLYATYSMNSTSVSYQAPAKPTQCLVGMDSSLTSMQFAIGTYTSTRSNYLNTQSAMINVGSTAYAYLPTCPGGTVIDEDTLGFFYAYNCHNVTGIMKVITYRHTVSPSFVAGGYSIGSAFIMTPIDTPLTCAAPITLSTPLVPYINVTFDFSTYVDYSTNAFTLTPVNGPTLVANDPTRGPDTVLSFGTTGSTLKSVNFGAAVLPESYTYCFFINLNAATPTNTMVFESEGLSGGVSTTTANSFFMIWLGSTMKIGQYAGGSLLSMTLNGVIGDVYLVQGYWWHYTVTYDAPSGVLSWYADGLFIQSVTASTNHQTAWTGGLNMELGSSGSTNSVQGLVDNFMVFNTVLNATQVQYNFRSAYKPRPVNSATTLANTIANPQIVTWTQPTTQLTVSYNLTITAYNLVTGTNVVTTPTTAVTTYTTPSFNSSYQYQVSITAIRYDGSGSVTPLIGSIPPAPVNITGIQSAFGGDLYLNWSSLVTVSTYYVYISINGTAPITVTQSATYYSWTNQVVGTNISVSIQSQTSSGFYSGVSATQTFTIYGPIPTNAYMQFLWNGNTLDTSQNMFPITGVGIDPPTYGTVNGHLSSSWVPSGSARPVYTLSAPTSALPKSFSFATWINVYSGSTCPLFASAGVNLTSPLLPNSFAVSGCGIPFQLSMKSAGGFILTVADTNFLTSFAWYHVAWTYNGTSGTLSYYNNGILTATATNSLFISNWTSGLSITMIGTPGDIGFGGYLSSTNIFGYTLTANQVKSIMNLPSLNTAASPLAVTGLNNSVSATNILTWMAPTPQYSDLYGITYTGYMPNTQTVSVATTIYQFPVDTGITTYTYSAFNPNLYYVFSVVSTNYDGRTSANDTITIPSCPSQLTVVGIGGVSPNFTWVQSTDTAIDHFVVYVDYNNGTVTSQTTTNTFLSFVNVSSSTAITVMVQAVSSQYVYSANSTSATNAFIPTPYMRAQFRGGFSAGSYAATATNANATISFDSRMGPILSLSNTGGVKTGIDYSTTALPANLTFSVWVYFNGTQPNPATVLGVPNTGNPVGVQNDISPSGSWYFYYKTNGVYFEFYGTSSENYFTARASSPLPVLNTWTHYMVTLGPNNGGSLANVIYVNGQASISMFYDSSEFTDWGAGLPIVAGCQGTYGTPQYDTCLNFIGKMKDLTFWSSALTPAQVETWYTMQLALYPTTPTIPNPPYLALGGPDATVGTTGKAVWTDFSPNAWPVSATAYGAIVRAVETFGFSGRGLADIYDSNSYVDKYQYLNTTLGASYSLCAWQTNTGLQPDTLITNVGNTGALFGTNGLANSFWVGIQSGNLVSGNYIGGDTVSVSATWDSTQWHHWVVTYSATTGVLSVYIDGVFQASSTASGFHIANWAGGLPVQIGWDGTSSNYGFSGDFSDLRVFNLALTATQAAALYVQTYAAIGAEQYTPSTPTGLSFTGAGTPSPVFTWTQNNDIAIAQFRVYVNYTNGTIITAATTTPTYTVVTWNSSFVSVSVQAVTVQNVSSGITASVTVEITPPSTPTNLSFTGNGTSAPVFTWTQNNVIPVVQFVVYVNYNNGTNITATTTVANYTVVTSSTSNSSSVSVAVQAMSIYNVYSSITASVTAEIIPPYYMRALFRGGFTASQYSGTASSSNASITSDSRFGPVLQFAWTGNVATGIKTSVEYTTTALPRLFSIGLWVNFNDNLGDDDYANVFGVPNTSDPSWMDASSSAVGQWFFGLQSGNICFMVFVTGDSEWYTTCTAFTSSYQWVHFVVSLSFNPSNSKGVLAVYQNGVLLGTSNISAQYFPSWTGGLPIVIGCQGTYPVSIANGCTAFAGTVKDIIVWSTGLNAAQVAIIYQQQLALYPTNPQLSTTPYLALGGPDATAGTTGKAVWTDFSPHAWPVSAAVYGAIVRDVANLGFNGRGRMDIYDNNSYGDKYQYLNATLSASYTLAAWIANNAAQPDTLITNVGNTGLLFGTNGLNNSFWVGLQGGNIKSGNYVNGDTLQLSYPWDSTQWHHFIITYAASTGIMLLFVDGTFLAEAVANAGHIASWTSGLPIQIGWDGTTSNFGFAGDFSDLRIFNFSFNFPQAAQLYSQTYVPVGDEN